MKSKLYKNYWKNRKGGIGTIVAMIVSIILVLGLISYAVLGQVAGAKDVGDKAQVEQDKINRMLDNPDVVTGNVVKDYISQLNGGVVVRDSANTSTLNLTAIVDGALYEITDRNYDVNGKLASIEFKQVNLSR